MRLDKLLMDHVALHKQLRMKTTLEPVGLIPGTNIYRPADLLPVPYLNDVKALPRYVRHDSGIRAGRIWEDRCPEAAMGAKVSRLTE